MSLFDDITSFVLGVAGISVQVENIITDIELLVEHVRKEVKDIQDFKVNPKFKTRVINAPKAMERTKELVTTVPESLRSAFVSLKSNLKAIVKPGIAQGIAQRGVLPGEAAGGRAIFQALNKVKLLLGEFSLFVKSLDKFVEALRAITEELQTFDTIFLPQTNKRRVEKLVDGREIKERIGGRMHQF